MEYVLLNNGCTETLKLNVDMVYMYRGITFDLCMLYTYY
jgi:hypothetical protein